MYRRKVGVFAVISKREPGVFTALHTNASYGRGDGTHPELSNSLEAAKAHVRSQGGSVEIWKRVAVVKAADPIVEMSEDEDGK